MILIWLIKKVFYNFLLLIYKKTSDLPYNRKNKEVILNRAKKYYENDNKRLRDQARDKYTNLSDEEKNKKREYGKNRNHNMSEEKKQKLKEYQKNTVRLTSLNLIIKKIEF